MFKKSKTAIAATTAALLLMTGCAGDTSAELHENGDMKSIEIGVFSGWPEGIAVSQVWRIALEDAGYDVTLTTADAAPAYLAVANGDFDLVLDSWMPHTHEAYWDEYGDQMENLGAWYTNAKNTMVVNDDAPITSLDELAEHADEFDNRIVGMEAGAGLTKITDESVIPEYGLDDMDFITSSTPALLAELKAATEAGDNVVATLARPYWAFDAYPIRELEDPKGAYGDAEEIRTTARAGFSEDYPTVAQWLQDFEMGDEYLLPLCNMIFNEHEDEDPADVTEIWAQQEQEWMESLTESK